MTAAVAFVVGPPDHGVVRHAQALAAAAGWPVVDRADGVPAGAWAVLDVTDRLWGATSDVSGPALAAALDALHQRGARVATALHDVPFDGDGAVFARRAAVYRCVVQRSDAVFVCSEVERARLAELVPSASDVAVLPVPLPALSPAPAGGCDCPLTSVTVLGYVYPGKGHAEVLAAMAGLPPDVPLVCVGRASDGHEDLVSALRAADRPVHVTGFVPDADLPSWLHAATVPVAPNRVVSASASIAAWWAHGRRPLVPDVPYTREIGTAATLQRYNADLAGAVQAAFRDPASTWLPAGSVAGPTVADVAAQRHALLARWSA